MLTRFFPSSEITNYFKRGELKDDLLNNEAMGICSIADLLDICEAYKKGNLSISLIDLHRKFEAFMEKPIKKGQVFIADLNQDTLSSALFERDDEVIVDLWQVAANRNISPQDSVRYLTLRVTNNSVWWSEEVYLEMTDYYTI